ncbi:MAG: AAA family ATPase [Proteobacteria bacterium]|nr:AAA family ATPase [Pseudomonadota bacterium]MDA0855114.1 AAA family ATPase [Pseudomonadota bacterium]
MNQLSLNLVSDDLPDYVIDDPVEILEIQYPREALLWLLGQQYGPQVKLERTKDNRVNGVLYKCPCPVHHNDGDTRSIVYLDQRLRIYCQSCKATSTLPQLLENCEIDPADILQHILQNLDQLQQHFERLDPDIEKELLRSWQGDLLTGSIDLPILDQTTHNNPQPPSVCNIFNFDNLDYISISLPDSWDTPPELEQALLDLQQAISTAAAWSSPLPELQSPIVATEQDQMEVQHDERSRSEISEPKTKPKPKKSTNSLIGTDDAQSDLTLVLTSTVAERTHLLSCEKFQPAVIAPAKGVLNDCRDQLLPLPAANYLLVLQEDAICRDLAKFLFQCTQKPVLQVKIPKGLTLLEIATEELADLKIRALQPDPKAKTSDKAGPVITSMQDLLARHLPPRRFLLEPLLPEQSIILVAAAAGTGKTFFAMEIAYAVATGGKFLDWSAPEPAGVLYVDGELPLNLLQERIRLLHQVHKHLPNNFNLLARDEQQKGIPCLSTPEGQEFIEQALQPDTKLIVLDNISTLVRSGLENESRSWQPIQDWTLEMRLRGYSILLIHHTGKSGDQRGTSSRIDTPDGAIKLTPLEVPVEEGTTSMLLTYIKPLRHARKSKQTEQRKLTMTDGVWKWEAAEISNRERIAELLEANWKQSEIARELGISASAVCQHVKHIKKEQADNDVAWSEN